jgi:pimeloyl-ACP methyl ester carboxylesterase
MHDDESGMHDVNGASISYEVAGSGSVIVLIHAGITDCRMWDAQLSPFAEGHRVLRYDMRGFGASSLPAGDYAHHDDLRVLLDALGIDRAAVIGASYGGDVALAFALEVPARVDALVLVNTLAGTTGRSPALRAGWAEMEGALDAGRIDDALEVELRMWVDGPHRAPGDVDGALRDRVRNMDSALLRRQMQETGAIEAELDPPALDRLEEVTAPTLVIAGTLDLPDALASAEALAARIPNARRVSIEGAAHLPSMEHPDEFNRIVLEFLRDTVAAR